MIEIIKELVDVGAAYVVPEKGVYFSVAGLAEYGHLAGRTLDQLLEDAGQRVDVDEDKKSPLDFALWKSAKPEEPSWDTPWGLGRPGWHTECVAMSLSALGPGFDIHGGGDDLCFPHHQHEWAQVVATGREFARHWIHSAMVNVSGEKMSKSLGNFTNLEEAIDSAGARALRLLALQTHYRKTMEMGRDSLMAASAAVDRLDSFHRRMSAGGVSLSTGPTDEAALLEFRKTMEDDFGTPAAVDRAFSLIRQANSALDANNLDASGIAARTALTIFSVLGIEVDSKGSRKAGGLSDDEITALIDERRVARQDKDFDKADQIRDQLSEAGIALEDSSEGVTWHRL